MGYYRVTSCKIVFWPFGSTAGDALTVALRLLWFMRSAVWHLRTKRCPIHFHRENHENSQVEYWKRQQNDWATLLQYSLPRLCDVHTLLQICWDASKPPLGLVGVIRLPQRSSRYGRTGESRYTGADITLSLAMLRNRFQNGVVEKGLEIYWTTNTSFPLYAWRPVLNKWLRNETKVRTLKHDLESIQQDKEYKTKRNGRTPTEDFHRPLGRVDRNENRHHEVLMQSPNNLPRVRTPRLTKWPWLRTPFQNRTQEKT